nr:hypothetical protein [Brevundimonas diminuta]
MELEPRAACNVRLGAERQFGDVGRTLLLQLLGREGGDRHRHVLQRFVATARADDDVVDGRNLLADRRRLLSLRRSGHHAESGARQQGGLHESVHVHPNLVSGPIDAFIQRSMIFCIGDDLSPACQTAKPDFRHGKARPVAPLH